MLGATVRRVAMSWLPLLAVMAGSGCGGGLGAGAGWERDRATLRGRVPMIRPVDDGAVREDDGNGAEPARSGWGPRRPPHRFPYVGRKLTCRQAKAVAEAAAPSGRLEPALVLAVMRVESAFSANVISRAGAVGLMQVMPDNVERLGCGDLFDADQNAVCGVKILRRFLDRYDGDLMLALSGYNAGLGMPGRARAEVRTPANFSYVEKVLRFRARYLRQGCKAFD